jgi:hypothetical protein
MIMRPHLSKSMENFCTLQNKTYLKIPKSEILTAMNVIDDVFWLCLMV